MGAPRITVEWLRPTLAFGDVRCLVGDILDIYFRGSRGACKSERSLTMSLRVPYFWSVGGGSVALLALVFPELAAWYKVLVALTYIGLEVLWLFSMPSIAGGESWSVS